MDGSQEIGWVNFEQGLSINNKILICKVGHKGPQLPHISKVQNNFNVNTAMYGRELGVGMS